MVTMALIFRRFVVKLLLKVKILLLNLLLVKVKQDLVISPLLKNKLPRWGKHSHLRQCLPICSKEAPEFTVLDGTKFMFYTNNLILTIVVFVWVLFFPVSYQGFSSFNKMSFGLKSACETLLKFAIFAINIYPWKVIMNSSHFSVQSQQRLIFGLLTISNQVPTEKVSRGISMHQQSSSPPPPGT